MSEHAHKLIEGLKLSREEYDAAVQDGTIHSGMRATYEGFLAQYYEDPERHGYICGEHIHRAHIAKDGSEWDCSWGLHTEDLSGYYLTDLNWMFLCSRFGKEEMLGIFAHKHKEPDKEPPMSQMLRDQEVERAVKIVAEPRINWVWYRAESRGLVAVFRFHKGSDEEDLLCDKFPQIKRYVPSGDEVAEGGEVVASYFQGGDYSLPEVQEAFGWLSNLLIRAADSMELESCKGNPTWRHLEFHGVEIFRAKVTANRSM